MSVVAVRLLGGFALSQDGQAVSGLDSTRLQSFLAYLLLHRAAPQPRQRLAFLFWPDTSETQARTNLRNLIHRLSQAWPSSTRFLSFKSKYIGWHPWADIYLDVAEFEQFRVQARSSEEPDRRLELLLQALNLYGGELLPDHYDEWILPERARLHRSYLQAVEQCSDLYEQFADYQNAIQTGRLLIQADPLSEAYYRRLMHLHVLNGDRAAALRAYFECADQLQREWKITPEAATQAAYRRLLVDDHTPAISTPPEAPAGGMLIGRSREWEQLVQTWQQISGGDRLASVVLISGDAGIGKTALANNLISWLRRRGETTVRAACYAPEADLSLAPVASWLRGLQLKDLDKIWLAEVARLLPELALDEPWTPSNADPQAPGEPWQKQRFYEALARAVLFQKQPVCLFLEDVQWSDAETLAWLHFLLRLDSQAKLMFVATLRLGETGPEHPALQMISTWRQQGRLVEIDLPSLTAEETAVLASSMVGEELPPEIVQGIYQRSEGNPLFIVETVRSVLERVETGAPGQALAQLFEQGAAIPASLPPKIQAVLRGRLEQISAGAHKLLEVAAVIGRSFSTELLLKAGDTGEDEVVRAVDELWHRRIIRGGEADAYDFSHDVFRQAVYAALSPARRRWLHGRVAQALEENPGLNLPNLAGRLAFHFEASGQAQKAFGYHCKAAVMAQDVYAYQEAVFHIFAALALVERAAAVKDPTASLYEQMGDIHMVTGKPGEARQAYSTALEHLTGQEDIRRAAVAVKLARTWLAQYALEQAWEGFEQAAILLGSPSGFQEEQWQILLDARLGQLDIYYYSDQVEKMAELADQIQPLLLQHGSLKQRSIFYQARVQMGSRQTRFRHTPEILADSQQALQLAQEAGDEALVLRSRFGLGFALLWGSEPRAAILELEDSVRASQVAGNIPLLDRCLAYLSIAYRLTGQTEALRGLLSGSRAAAENEQNRLYLGVALANQAWLAYLDGDTEGASSSAQSALDQWQNLSFPFQWLARWPLLAVCLSQGRLDEAVVHARAMLNPGQQPPVAEVARRFEAAVRVYPDHPQESRALFLEALQIAQNQQQL